MRTCDSHSWRVYNFQTDISAPSASGSPRTGSAAGTQIPVTWLRGVAPPPGTAHPRRRGGTHERVTVRAGGGCLRLVPWPHLFGLFYGLHSLRQHKYVYNHPWIQG